MSMELFRLNEFEYDRCFIATERVKNELLSLKGSRWLFFGYCADALTLSVLRFLHFASERLTLDLSLTLLTEKSATSVATELIPFADVRPIESVKEPIETDYCVHIGYSTVSDENFAAALTRFWIELARPTRRSLCLSNDGAYGHYPYPVAASEREYQQTVAHSQTHFAEELIRQTQKRYLILRSGAILGGGSAIESPITALLDGIAQGSITELCPQTQYTLVYLTDLLTALVFLATADVPSGEYNVGSKEATATLGQICALYYEVAPHLPELNVKFIKAPDERNHALDTAKLEGLGWHAATDLRQMLALEASLRGLRSDLDRSNDCYRGKLTSIQSLLRQMLVEVDRICKKHGIRYFLGGGSLLGAIRCQGFIPWDDDLDIMMLREDYDRFLAVAPNELPEQLFLQTPNNESGDHYLISKIRLNGTVFSSEFLRRFPKLHNGIFLDVIAQDYTSNSRLGQKLHIKLAQLARGLVYKKWSGESATVRGKGYAVFDLIKWLFPISALERFQHWALTLFSKKADRRYLYDSMGINIAKGAYPAEWLSDTVEVDFEGQKFPAPVEYDRYLSYLYGDYMQPIPLSQRAAVHGAPMVDLGDYADLPEIRFTYKDGASTEQPLLAEVD